MAISVLLLFLSIWTQPGDVVFQHNFHLMQSLLQNWKNRTQKRCVFALWFYKRLKSKQREDPMLKKGRGLHYKEQTRLLVSGPDIVVKPSPNQKFG